MGALLSKTTHYGVEEECIGNPDAVRVAMAVMELATDCLTFSHPRFNYYGVTEYSGENLNALVTRLSARNDALRACRWKREFDLLTPDISTGDCEQCLARRHRHWRHVRSQAVGCLDELLECAREAERPGKALLVLGA